MLSTDALNSRIFILDNTNMAKTERDAQIAQLLKEWQVWLAADHNIAHLPQAAQDKVYALAYEHGHAYGYEEIVHYYGDFAELVTLATA